MELVKKVAKKVAEAHGKGKVIARKLDCIREVVEERLQKTGKTEKQHLEGMVLNFHTRSSFAFKDDFTQALSDAGVLHRAVKIDSSVENLYNLSQYRQKGQYELKVSANRAKSAESEKRKQETENYKQKIQKRSLRELIVLFKNNKERSLENQECFEKYKQELFGYMFDKEKEKITIPSFELEGFGSFSVVESGTEYDMKALAKGIVSKNILIAYKKKRVNTEVIDLLTGDSISFKNDISFKDMGLSTFEDALYINGCLAQNITDLSQFPASTQKNVLEQKLAGYDVVMTKVLVSGEKVLGKCKIMASQVDALVDEGLLNQSFVDGYRYKDDSKEATSFLEIIDEQTDKLRKRAFAIKMNMRERNDDEATA